VGKQKRRDKSKKHDQKIPDNAALDVNQDRERGGEGEGGVYVNAYNSGAVIEDNFCARGGKGEILKRTSTLLSIGFTFPMKGQRWIITVS